MSHESSEEETVSYSETEMDVDDHESDEDVSNRAKANDVIATILEESDKLEQQTSKPKKGKQRMTKEESVKHDFWRLISDMQAEITSLKRSSRPDSESEPSRKKSKANVEDRPSSSGYVKVTTHSSVLIQRTSS